MFCDYTSLYYACSFFFLILLRPPSAIRTDTLLPYTTLFRADGAAAAVVAEYAGDRLEIDDGGAVDLLERGRVEYGQQVADRGAQQRLAFGEIGRAHV